MLVPGASGQPASESAPRNDRTPALDKDAFDCPRCGVYAHQEWNLLAVSETELIEQSGQRYALSLWKQAVCGRCAEPSLWRKDQMIYPLARLGAQPHSEMPAEVRALYTEAAAVAAVSRRAGAALARAMVERLIKLLDPDAPKKANLDQRIDRIRQQVSTPLGELLELVRYLGNKMLHIEEPGQLGDLVVLALDDTEGPPVLELLLDTANDLVDELITRPRTVASLRNCLPETVRAKLDRDSG